jgi:hypothetical protein
MIKLLRSYFDLLGSQIEHSRVLLGADGAAEMRASLDRTSWLTEAWYRERLLVF